jgi:hypothetical protein
MPAVHPGERNNTLRVTPYHVFGLCFGKTGDERRDCIL